MTGVIRRKFIHVLNNSDFRFIRSALGHVKASSHQTSATRLPHIKCQRQLMALFPSILGITECVNYPWKKLATLPWHNTSLTLTLGVKRRDLQCHGPIAQEKNQCFEHQGHQCRVCTHIQCFCPWTALATLRWPKAWCEEAFTDSTHRSNNVLPIALSLWSFCSFLHLDLGTKFDLGISATRRG